MNALLSFVQGVVVLFTVITAPITKAILPAAYINQIATSSAEVREASPSPVNFTPSPGQTQKDNNSKEQPASEDVIRAEDYFDYMNQKATFYIDIPKKGGKIRGKITGFCNGDVTGEFNGQIVGESVSSDRHDIVGKATGTCNVGFIPVPAEAKFFGEVSFAPPFKRVVLTVDIEKPIQTRAYPVMRIW